MREKLSEKAEAILLERFGKDSLIAPAATAHNVPYIMNEQVKMYIEKCPKEIADMFKTLRQLIYDSVSVDLAEAMWAKLPSYYVGENFVRLIPFKDHINIEAQAIIQHKEELADYKITPKGMLQIYVNQNMPKDILLQIFAETLGV